MTLALVLAALLAAPPEPRAPGPGAADADLRERVEAMLGTLDTRLPGELWRGLGPGASPVLDAIARDEARMPSTRARAVAALAAVDPGGAERLSRDLAESPDAPPTVRQAAVRALGHLLAPEALVAALAPVLRAGDRPALRAVAAEAMARRAPGLACAEVLDQAGREAARDRPAFERAAALCAAR